MKCLTLPFGMLCDVFSCFQHKAHKLCHVEGIVGKLRVVPKCWMVTLREVIKSIKSIGKSHIKNKMQVFRLVDRATTLKRNRISVCV